MNEERRLLVVFATPMEAQATLKDLEASPTDRPHVYHFDRGRLLITGLGITRAAAMVASHLDGIDEVWNIGIAGALDNALRLHKLYDIGAVSKYLQLPPTANDTDNVLARQGHPRLLLASQGQELVSSDFPIHDLDIKSRLVKQAQLVDMEGYGVALAASTQQIPCRLWKLVSDFSSQADRHQILLHLEAASQRLSEALQEQLEQTSVVS